MKIISLPETHGAVWHGGMKDDLRHATDMLVHEVIQMICTDPMQQTELERAQVVAYLNSMAAAIREAR